MSVLKRIWRVLSIVLTAVLALLFACNLYVIAARYITGAQQPSVFGYSTAVVISGSMSGSIEVNDLIVIHKEDEYEVNDVITFKSGESLVTHRIIGEGADGFITKGDANNSTDPRPVAENRIVGKVVFVIPKIGMIIEGLRTPLGMTGLVLFGFALIELPSLLEALNEKKGGAADDENQK